MVQNPETYRNLTDPIVIASIAGAAVSIIGSIAAAVVMVLQAFKKTNAKLDEAATKVVENDRKTDRIAEKASEIKELANGNLTELRHELKEANAEIRRLNKELRVQHTSFFKKYGIDRREDKRATR